MADEVQPRKGQEGGRWVNERPSGEAVASWFKANVQAHKGMNLEHYVSGLTLISAQEKTKEPVGFRENGTPILHEMEHAIFTPYVKVETRVKYFHDLMAQKGDEWVGFIDPVVPEEPHPSLPPGFFRMVVRQKDGEEVVYVCCSMQVTVFKREGFAEEKVLLDSRKGLYEMRRRGEVVISGPAGTKMVPLLHPWGRSDANAIMKAETGAVGRALGFAGMLVAPGSGVATAEDMEEARALANQGSAPAPAPAELPGQGGAVQSGTPDELRKRAVALINELQVEFSDRHQAFLQWCQERKFAKVSELDEPALKGMIRKVERELDEGRRARDGEPAAEQPSSDSDK